MSVSVDLELKATAKEALTVGVDAATAPVVTHQGFNTTKTLGASSTPPATKVSCFVKALAAGVATIDLTALVGVGGAVIDGTGLRVQVLKFKPRSTNTHVISIAKGAANGYDGFGATFQLTLGLGAQAPDAIILPGDNGADIGPTNKNLDLAGTGTESVDVEIILG